MQNTTQSARAKQIGYISIELLFVLIVILIGMGYALYNGWGAMGSSDVNNEQGNVGQLIANTRKLKGSTGYGASGTDLIAQLSSIRGLPIRRQALQRLEWAGHCGCQWHDLHSHRIGLAPRCLRDAGHEDWTRAEGHHLYQWRDGCERRG